MRTESNCRPDAPPSHSFPRFEGRVGFEGRNTIIPHRAQKVEPKSPSPFALILIGGLTLNSRPRLVKYLPVEV
jgi:hypothetical protein